MGFNISGLAINKNFKDDFDELQKELGWNLERKGEIYFETASSNWKEEGICDVYFTDNGTLIFINMEMCTDYYKIKNCKTLTFALSETSMAFNLNYSENSKELRSIMEVEGVRHIDEGAKLDIENNQTDTSEIIWLQIDKIIGEGFQNIELDEKAIRYIFTTNKGSENKKEFDIDTPISKEDLSNKFGDDELFEYFDKIIDFAKQNRLNIFLHPWAHSGNSRKFMNLFSIITEIKNRPNLTNQITKRMPLQRFDMICKFDPEKIDNSTNLKMLKELDLIQLSNSTESNTTINSISEEIENSTEKKWWQFWK